MIKQPRVKRLQARYEMERNEYMREYLKDPYNKERHNKSVYKSHAKKFVKEFATSDDMDELLMIWRWR